jgi:hypothetical protein
MTPKAPTTLETAASTTPTATVPAVGMAMAIAAATLSFKAFLAPMVALDHVN